MHLEAEVLMICIVLQLAQGTKYLAVIAKKPVGTTWLTATSDETGGTLKYYSPKYGWGKSVDMEVTGEAYLPIHQSDETFNDVEYKVIMIECSNNNAYVWVSDRYMAFAPLPVTALGTKYIVSSCYHAHYPSLLVIVAYNVTTSVSINAGSKIFGPSFNRTDTYSFKLESFKTFTYEYSDLTGTVVTSTQAIAVFSGMTGSRIVLAYEQLLPVRLYDVEYDVTFYGDKPSLYYIQILSEHDDTVITFNDGLSFTGRSKLYQRQRMFPRFKFHATNPVMVTLCKRKWQYSAFIVVPPTSLCANRCTVAFSYHRIHADGITYKQPHQIEIRKSFLIALPYWMKYTYMQLSSSEGASYQVVFPHHNRTQTRQMQASSSDVFYFMEGMEVQYGHENKAILVNVDTEDIQLSVVIGRQGYLMWVLNIFPASLLGREYRLQECFGKKPFAFRLITVSSSSDTDVNILLSHPFTYYGREYKPGDTIRKHLQPHQTLTINSYGGLCGSYVSASHNVAVYIHSNFGNFSSYTQLLPLRLFGNEYIVVANDEALNFNTDYYMLVKSAANRTEIIFNHDVKVTLGNGISYRKDLGVTESVYFSSTKPVTTSLCNFHSHQCTVIVPTKLYTTTSMFEVPGEKTVLNLLTDRVEAEVNLTWSSKYINYQHYKYVNRYQNKSIEITWETHKDYKIGTAKVDKGLIFISSTHRFTTLAFSYINSEQREGVLWNPIGWTRQTADGDRRITYHDDRTVPVTIGTTFGVLIVILLAATLSHQIYIRRKAALTIERTDGRSGEHEITSDQDQPQGNPNETTM